MSSSVGAGRTRTAAWLLFAAVVLILIVDGGSCALARVQVDDLAKSSGRFAVQSITGQPINQATAEVAYSAAVSALPTKTETFVVRNAKGEDQDFRVNADGSITMTVQRTAPTLVFRWVPVLNQYPVASVTFTQLPLGI